MVRRILRFLAAGLLLAVPWAFAYGPLFPWSLVRPGYQRLESARALVLYPTGSELNPAYRQVDSIMKDAEEFHALGMPHRLKVIVCRNWSDFFRFLPAIRSKGVGAATLDTGTVIYMTPRLEERRLDPREFLRHEIAHAIVHQNMPIWRTWRARRNQWTTEGIPVWFGGQKSYVSQSEFAKLARTRDVAAHIDPDAARPAGFDIRFAYIAWRNYLDYLDQTHGHDRFLHFLHRYMEAPTRQQTIFRETYQASIAEAASAFQSAVRDGKFHPRD